MKSLLLFHHILNNNLDRSEAPKNTVMAASAYNSFPCSLILICEKATGLYQCFNSDLNRDWPPAATEQTENRVKVPFPSTQ